MIHHVNSLSTLAQQTPDVTFSTHAAWAHGYTGTKTNLVCLEVRHDSKHISLAQHPLPPRVIGPSVPHLVVVAAVCIKHLVNIEWGGKERKTNIRAQHQEVYWSEAIANAVPQKYKYM